MNLKRAATIIIPIILLGVALGLGVYFLFFRKTGKEGYSKYTKRQWVGTEVTENGWACPSGYKDMMEKASGDKQCKVNKNTKFAGKIWDEARGGSVCPKGFDDYNGRCVKQKYQWKGASQKDSMEKEFPHWGWGAHEGLRCRNPDNTGCDTKYGDEGLQHVGFNAKN